MKFIITEDEAKNIYDWNKSHKCKLPQTAIGGNLKYIFTPTGLGTLIMVKCLCGESYNVRGSDNW